jgi:MerR family transcriptional regulator, light-induced transcriptional regulator
VTPIDRTNPSPNGPSPAEVARLAAGLATAGTADDDEMRAHVEHLVDAVEVSSVELFLAHVRWTQTTRLARGASSETLAHELARLSASIASLGDAHPSARSFVDAALRLAATTSDASWCALATNLDPGAPLAATARVFLDHLLAGRRRQASAAVFAVLRDGAALVDVYLHVFQRSQQELGRLWQLGKISVAQEHFCTAATQVIISQVQAGVFDAPRKGRTVLAACIAGNMHEVGLRIIVDVLEINGWDTQYLGANTPIDEIKAATVLHRPDILAVSTALLGHVRPLRSLIEAIRADRHCAQTKIIVGGLPFNMDEDLWRRIGADGHARDAGQAARLAEELVGGAAIKGAA